MKPAALRLVFVLSGGLGQLGAAQSKRAPVIDLHFHAERLDAYIAAQPDRRWWPQLTRPTSDDALMRASIAALEQHNVVRAVTSEDLADVERWRRAAPDRLIPGVICRCTTPAEWDSIRVWATSKRIAVIGELVWQYLGFSPSDPTLDPLWTLAEEHDLPLGIHLGLMPPGWTQTTSREGRMRLGSPLVLEDALVRHPRARVYIMHAGWPFLDDLVALLHQYPNVYAEVSWIDWYIPRAEFHAYLQRLVNAGFGTRILFGSDQMQWPESIGLAIEAIEAAPFLTLDQRRDILCNNAARFLRLDMSLFANALPNTGMTLPAPRGLVRALRAVRPRRSLCPIR